LHATRPKRIGEIDNQRHIFVDAERFFSIVYSGGMQEYTGYKIADGSTIYYGMSIQEFEICDFTTKTPITISSLNREDIFIIYLNIPEEVCLSRMLERKNNVDDPHRRISSDREDFKRMTEYIADIEIIDPLFDVEAIYNIVIDRISEKTF